MVNELLVALEEHPLPFACATNHIEAFDPAALRRFAFKVKFDFPTKSQTEAAYRRFFARAAPPGLGDMTALTPGDFAVVARQLRLLGGDVEDNAILRLLAQEVRPRTCPPGGSVSEARLFASFIRARRARRSTRSNWRSADARRDCKKSGMVFLQADFPSSASSAKPPRPLR